MRDLHSRRLIGWAVLNRMKRDLAIKTLEMAVALRQPSNGCIYYTDRDNQDCLHNYRRYCASMGSKCRCQARAIATAAPMSRPSSRRSRLS
ncbi:hypothetical protein [Epibacterium ulvae]|uniref:hypothetical protein n=1 Tax=Epibacterium ulvae TaxID=1156985 RepID=UPI003CD0E211